MFDEEATFKKFGYHSYDLKPKSGKKVVAVCDDCGKVRVLSKQGYHARCSSCVSEETRKKMSDAHKGIYHLEEARKKLSDANKGESNPNWQGGLVMSICEECGVEFPVFPSTIKRGEGKFCTQKCYGKWMTKHLRGKNHPNWQGGLSYGKYCEKFNDEFKEKIRDKFGRVCFLCGKTEEDNGRKLSVHHVNGNKECGCDGDETCQFVPLCISCHGKVHSKKVDWEAKIKAKMHNKLNGWYI